MGSLDTKGSDEEKDEEAGRDSKSTTTESRSLSRRAYLKEAGMGVTGLALGAAMLLETSSESNAATATLAESAPETPPVVTHHSIETKSGKLSYTVTTGMMPLKTDAGEKEADVFYMAYTLDGADKKEKRSLMFSFNGGPGSASVWLHMGALGPKRVKMLDDGNLPPPPYQLADNPETWLVHTDLVFIDPVGTGFSRPAKPELGKKFWGVQGDIASIGEFIRLYLTRNERWRSPLFLVGESYGTTRAAGLSGYLVEKGIALNGIVLISSVLNFQTLNFGKGNDLPYALFLPTYCATAWYHKKLPADLQASLKKTLAEVEKWTESDYFAALAKGDALSQKDRAEVVNRLARYTGLSKRYIEDNNLRINIFRFCKELLRDQKRTVGRLDSRIKGFDALNASETPDFDPSMTAIRPPYTALFNDYVRTELGYKTDQEYYILGGGIKSPWDWGGGNEYADTSESLRSAFAKNPYMKLFVASGYYDLATPYFATHYTLNHTDLASEFHANISLGFYEAGHMMYIEKESLAKLQKDVASFLETTVK